MMHGPMRMHVEATDTSLTGSVIEVRRQGLVSFQMSSACATHLECIRAATRKAWGLNWGPGQKVPVLFTNAREQVQWLEIQDTA